MATTSYINSFNEWDPLEEVIIGHPGKARVACLDAEGGLSTFAWTFPQSYVKKWRKPFNNFEPFTAVSDDHLKKAIHSMESLKSILRANNVKIKQVADIDWGKMKFKSPFYEKEIPSGFCGWNPRDMLLPAGQCIIESALAYRQRAYEWVAYVDIRNEYIGKHNAEWISSPRVMRRDSFYNWDAFPAYNTMDLKVILSREQRVLKEDRWAIKDGPDIMWEAADVLRCGKDVFIQKSHVTNELGISWLSTVLKKKGFRVHRIRFENEPYAVHLDTSIALLKPGIGIISPSKGLDKKTRNIFEKSGWKLYDLPHDKFKKHHPFKEHYDMALNFLSINENEIVCGSEYTAKYLRSFGCRVHVVDYTPGIPLIGAIHCNTCDVRRRGGMVDYLSAARAKDSKL